MAVARIVRGEVLALKEREFVEASRSSVPVDRASCSATSSRTRSARSWSPSALAVVGAILAESTLSFFGYGPSPGEGSTTWGLLIGQSKRTILSGYWWLVRLPVRFLVITIVCINFVGDGLRDAFDPEGETWIARVTDAGRLEVRDLHVSFPARRAAMVQAVRGVDVTVQPGELLGVVGESGSGKSVTFLAAMGLLPSRRSIDGSVKVARLRAGQGDEASSAQAARGQEDRDDLPGSAVGAQPDARIGRQVAEMIRVAPGRVEGSGCGSAPSSCSTSSASRNRRIGPGSTHTSSRAACASA